MLYNGNASVLKFIPNVDRSYTVDVILLIEPRISCRVVAFVMSKCYMMQ